MASLFVPAGPAMAEGGFDSSLGSVTNGYRTRTWTDRNLDANASTTSASGCSRSDGATFLMEVELRQDQFGPDRNLGRKNLSACRTSTATGNWGRAGAGNFFNQVFHYNFGTVSARTYNVRY